MPENRSSSDLVIVGAGIVGLATAYQAQRKFPDLTITVVEAEAGVGRHQSGHNSGVIHSGLYYKPGSEKALNCRRGKAMMEEFCSEHSIPWDRCGKVVVATDETETERLSRIAERAAQNGVEFSRIDSQQLNELEPNTSGVAALHVPESGIVNYGKVCNVLADRIRDRGGFVKLSFAVSAIDIQSQSVELQSRSGETISCDRMINCGGLYSDRVCRLTGVDPGIRIVPFRGEYYELVSQSESLCRNLIYPVPDPDFPFLGVHFTRMIDGGVECGPNAVLALSRVGYRWSHLNLRDLLGTFAYKGFRKFAAKHWRTGFGEMHRSLRKSAFVSALKHLIPAIKSSDLKPGRSGVRAQALSPEGNLVDDFLIRSDDRAVHVLNAPSPAATASLAIGERVVEALG